MKQSKDRTDVAAAHVQKMCELAAQTARYRAYNDALAERLGILVPRLSPKEA